MDDGDLWLQIPVAISKEENFTELSERMGQLGSQSWAIPVAKQLQYIGENSVKPTAQTGDGLSWNQTEMAHLRNNYNQQQGQAC